MINWKYVLIAWLSLVFLLTTSKPAFQQDVHLRVAETFSNSLKKNDIKRGSHSGGVGEKMGDLRSNSVSSDPDDVNWDDRFDQLGVVSGAVLALAASGTDLYVGGVFSQVGAVSASNIAKWDGSAWSALGSGTDGNVLAIAVDGTDIIVGGNFSSAGGTTVNNIAKWDGSNWTAMGSGIENGDVRTISVNSNDIYVGGVFSTAGGQTANNIAKWNGSAWSTLGTGANNGLNGPVYAVAVKDNNLFVGGSFSLAGTDSASNIAAWDISSESWSALGTGVNSNVNALTISGSDLYAGGLFGTAGGNTAKKIARWDGSNWSALGSGMTGGNIDALATMGNELFAAGSFTTAGSVSASQIAKWDGSAWSALGSGIAGGPAFGLATISDSAYVGGSFSTAGGKTSKQFGRWSEPSGAVPVELVSFSARPNANAVELRWTTATELNNYGFELERMINNSPLRAWDKIAFVQGHGTTNQPQAYSFFDNVQALVRSGALTLSYRLKQIDLDGSFEYHQAVEVTIAELPDKIILGQNYPNPFNPETVIEFAVPVSGFATLKVYNMLGQEVQTLLQENLEGGAVHKVNFDGTSLPTGMYYYVLSTTKPVRTARKAMLLVK